MFWIHFYPLVQVEHEVVIVNKIYLLKVNQGYIEMKYLEIYTSKENDMPQGYVNFSYLQIFRLDTKQLNLTGK